MDERGPALGVLGGMGPLATAEFLRTLYEVNLTPVEQHMPRVILDCDPGLLPDRTKAIRASDSHGARRLEQRLRGLCMAGAGPVVLACVTAHHFLTDIEPALRRRVISLTSVTAGELAARPGRFLVLATAGAREARVFERDPGWPAVASRVTWPGADDQERVHRLVYRMKQLQASPSDEVTRLAGRLRDRYDCDGVLLGCTEFHLHARALTDSAGPGGVLDPLRCVAAALPQYLADPTCARPPPGAHRVKERLPC